MVVLVAVVAMTCAMLASCQSTSTPAAPGADNAASREIQPGPYTGPAMTVDLLTQRMMDTPERVAVLEVIAPTGGHEFMLDDAAVDAEAKHLQLFVTLVQPGADEVTTQALATHHLTYRNTTMFETVEVFVRTYRSGEPTTAYTLATSR